MDDVSRSQLWQPLDPSRREIRLLILQPDKDRHAFPIGRLITVSLEQQLHYDAISHAWGGPSEVYYININKIKVPITSNVLDVLQHLRDPHQEKAFWIDSLCINQYDTKERAEQVKLMEHIFHRAVQVQAWLGCESAGVERLIDDINNDKALQKLFRGRDWDRRRQNEVSSLKDFVSIRYWSRVWILQELALARSVVFVFGKKSFAMKRLEKLDGALRQARQESWGRDLVDAISILLPIISAANLFPMATTGSREEKARRAVKMLSRARRLGCSDARDRIYGMIGIMTAMFGPDFIDAGYECSLREVYTRFAGRLISETGSLAILNQAEVIFSSIEGLPTWVPDWASRSVHDGANYRMEYCDWFHAAGEFSVEPKALAPTCMSSLSRSSVLKCMGFIFGMVRVTGAYCGSYRWPNSKRELRPMIESWRQTYSGSVESFMRTITLSLSARASDLEECYKAGESGSTETERRIRRPCMDATSERRFFVTNNNAPGLGPRDTRPGDFLAVLAGGRVPYVLRRSSKPDALPNTYALVGECFVDGVMYGELFKGTRPPEFSDIYIE
ncbi:uncharacterized protein Z520_06604 [Fonsecaea multimorphosa CBS 102226]|uniref:Heterokaryon incompatibility domain-containing protein n=1 Tax=Fonsecaea multimorphosa CBS 102226 TaxID=1442371 RepID=A0A0D2ILC4_9EURO|nr:uncharacterized protein Z520_06604 [Fonsecaea multimorphosa CBS 102226]KIX97826.1 hypothetical protein Z520_06604 [Fonsecaea multimorphosa CBS 102226]OAL23596.1 hypothetical protein AYO22_06173 [Fonsecaea multimorphosa]